MIEHGGDVKAINAKNGKTPLHETEDEDTAQVLIDNGADVEQEDFEGRTPLHCNADFAGDKNTVMVLIKNGANVNNPGSIGMTPSDYASDYTDNIHIAELIDSTGKE